MRLNSIGPAQGATRSRKRRGRGIGSGLGKTAGRGHKGQKARAGGYHKLGFEGGQMPIQRRLPKVGFHSRLSRVTGQVTLTELGLAGDQIIDVAALQRANLLSKGIKRAKVIASGAIAKAVTVKGLRVSRGARAAIEAAGGKVEQ
ncbi:MAG: 50S ribosomal protein L15 [Gammaproteobacteria bacterium]|nr:50S ribosomal protein L15 [Gammaproteobacteria bacterium]